MANLKLKPFLFTPHPSGNCKLEYSSYEGMLQLIQQELLCNVLPPEYPQHTLKSYSNLQYRVWDLRCGPEESGCVNSTLSYYEHGCSFLFIQVSVWGPCVQCRDANINIHSYTPHTLRACCSQSKFRILKIRESSARALFLYNCTPNISRSADVSVSVA